MPRLERLPYSVFPTLRLEGTPWYGLWLERERASVLINTRTALLFTGASYVLHYFFIDHPLGLTNDFRWPLYRFGLAALAIAGALLCAWPAFRRRGPYRLPLLVVGTVASVAQAWSMTWYPGVPYVYAFLIPVMTALMLADSQFRSTVWLCFVHALQTPAFSRTDVEPHLLWSAFIASVVVVIIFRSRMVIEIDSFLAQQDRLETQKKLIESEMELNREIRSFLPREVYACVQYEMRTHRKTVLQAMDEGLRPRVRTVACVFSDIRGFTQKSKDLAGYLANGALPNIRDCTEIIEEHRGISRLIGDLIFAYFDGTSAKENVQNAIRSGMLLARRTHEWNLLQPPQNRIHRHVLISYGEALVGNIGGLDSSREIKALGTPVNILARIDALTKDPGLAPYLSPDALILTRAASEHVRVHLPEVKLREINLAELGLSIRDFPEETSLYLAFPDSVEDEHSRTLRLLPATRGAA